MSSAIRVNPKWCLMVHGVMTSLVSSWVGSEASPPFELIGPVIMDLHRQAMAIGPALAACGPPDLEQVRLYHRLLLLAEAVEELNLGASLAQVRSELNLRLFDVLKAAAESIPASEDQNYRHQLDMASYASEALFLAQTHPKTLHASAQAAAERLTWVEVDYLTKILMDRDHGVGMVARMRDQLARGNPALIQVGVSTFELATACGHDDAVRAWLSDGDMLATAFLDLDQRGAAEPLERVFRGLESSAARSCGRRETNEDTDASDCRPLDSGHPPSLPVTPYHLTTTWSDLRTRLAEARASFTNVSPPPPPSFDDQFANHHAKTMKLLEDILRLCGLICGPSPCPYALVAMGSVARGEEGPYSDVEIAAILEDPNVLEHRDWDRFWSTFEMFVGLAGERTGFRVDQQGSPRDPSFRGSPDGLAAMACGRMATPGDVNISFGLLRVRKIGQTGARGTRDLVSAYEASLASRLRGKVVLAMAHLSDHLHTIDKAVRGLPSLTTIEKVDVKATVTAPILYLVHDLCLLNGVVNPGSTMEGIRLLAAADRRRPVSRISILVDFLKQLEDGYRLGQQIRLGAQLSAKRQCDVVWVRRGLEQDGEEEPNRETNTSPPSQVIARRTMESLAVVIEGTIKPFVAMLQDIIAGNSAKWPPGPHQNLDPLDWLQSRIASTAAALTTGAQAADGEDATSEDPVAELVSTLAAAMIARGANIQGHQGVIAGLRPSNRAYYLATLSRFTLGHGEVVRGVFEATE